MIVVAILQSITRNPHLLHCQLVVPNGLWKSDAISTPFSVTETLACGHVIRIRSFKRFRLDSDHRFISNLTVKASFNVTALTTRISINTTNSQNVSGKNSIIYSPK